MGQESESNLTPPTETIDREVKIQAEEARKHRKKRFKNWCIDWIASTVLLLVIAFLLEHLIDKKGVQELGHIQSRFHDFVSAFDPQSMIRYVFDTVGVLSGIVNFGLYHVLSIALSQSTVLWLLGSGVFGVLFFYTCSFR